MHIRFVKDHSYKPVPNSTTLYKIGHTANLPQAKAQVLIDSGVAELIEGKGMPPKSAVPATKAKPGGKAAAPTADTAADAAGEPAAEPAPAEGE